LQNQIPATFTIIDEEEQWTVKKPKPADHIKTPRAGGVYTHHGIYISDKEVIHFASEDSDNLLGTGNEIINTDLSVFLKGGELFVREYSAEEKTELWSDSTIITYARSCIGDDGYNLVFNNCEHFCNECTFGEHKSKQVEDVINPLSRGGSKMGFLRDLFSKDKTITTTTYEPDKVRVAEIENQTKLMLKKLEAENIKLNADLQKELVTLMINEEKSLIQAKAEGYSYLLNEISQFSQSMIELRIQKNIELVKNQNETEKDIISYYNDFSKQLEEQNRDFELNHLPQLNKMRNDYEKDSASYTTYSKLIEERLKLHIVNISEETNFFRNQRTKRLESSRVIHQIIEQHLNEINTQMLKIANDKSNLLELKDNEKALLEQAKIKMIGTTPEKTQKVEEESEIVNTEIIDARKTN